MQRAVSKKIIPLAAATLPVSPPCTKKTPIVINNSEFFFGTTVIYPVIGTPKIHPIFGTP